MRNKSGLSIRINPIFWIFAALLGFLISKNVFMTLIWVLIIFISVLFHEFGHALLAIFFKQSPSIQLIALGGVTSYQGKNLKYYQQFLIVLFGPVFGLILYLIAAFLLYLDFITGKIVLYFLLNMKYANLFWSIINLLPVMPMDGGQLLRIALEKFFGFKGFRYSLLVGFILASFLALFFFAFRSYLAGAIFFLLAFQSFEMYRRSRHMSKSDRDEKLALEIENAQKFFQEGKKEEAKDLLEDILKKTKNGLIFIEASHILAFIYFNEKQYKKTYDLLLNIKDDLQEDAIPMLHKLAFEEQNYKLVCKLSTDCYTQNPTSEVALNNAKAFGYINDAKASSGWLETVVEKGDFKLEDVLKDKAFSKVKNKKEFLKFFKNE